MLTTSTTAEFLQLFQRDGNRCQIVGGNCQFKQNKTVLKEINPEYSLEGLMLKLQYFGHLIQGVGPLENSVMLGKI